MDWVTVWIRSGSTPYLRTAAAPSGPGTLNPSTRGNTLAFSASLSRERRIQASYVGKTRNAVRTPRIRA